VSDSADLERRYRRLLACYPRAFRHAREQEILAVLMAGAEEGQQRPRLGEAADLIRSSLRMRLRPSVPPSRPTVFWAIRLMYLCAALKLLGVPILPATHHGSAFPLDISISWGAFALLAWANSRGHNWARVLFAVWVGFHALALFYDVAQLSASSIPVWTVIASVVFWLVEFSAVVLVVSKRSNTHYRHTPAEA
jgi:hypothetical protein